MSYMLEDHQGSVSAIASNSGAADVNHYESFSAFGARRDPTTWSGAPTTQNLNTIAGLSRQGYTFQTALGQSMGLNHMNGRVEDAILGRFLSPDPYIPDPTNAQSYNRYTYVNNNPLTYIDPTGFDEDEPSFTDNGGGGGGGSDGGGGNGGGGFFGVFNNSPPGLQPEIQVQCTHCCGSNSVCWAVSTDLILYSFGPPIQFGGGTSGGTSGNGQKPPAQRNTGLCSNASINAISGAAGGALAGGAALSEFGPGGIAVGAFLGGLAGGITGYVSTSTLANQVAGGAANGVVAPSFNAAASGATGGAVGGAFTYGAQQAGFPDVVSVPVGGAAGGFFAGAAATGVANSALTAAEGGAAGGAIGLAAGATTVAVAAALHAACGN